MNITMTVEDFKKMIDEHAMEVLNLKCKIYELEDAVKRNGMTDADIDQFAAYVEQEDRIKELEKRKDQYFTGNGTDCI